jgi:ribonuclease P/MRP protein subunit RPP40
LHWVEAFLSSQQQRVVIDGFAPAWLPVISGVPQWSVLGPVLFVVYINDLSSIDQSRLFLYADDTKVCRKSGCLEDSIGLQHDLDILCSWVKTWQLNFNVKKCQVMHFGCGNSKYLYWWDDVPLESVSAVKDLGVLVDDKLSFLCHINSAVLKANRLLGLLKRHFGHMDKMVLTKLYKAFVRPRLEYANIV